MGREDGGLVLRIYDLRLLHTSYLTCIQSINLNTPLKLNAQLVAEMAADIII